MHICISTRGTQISLYSILGIMLSIPHEQLKELLTRDGAITADVFDAAEKEASRMDMDVHDVLIARNAITQDYYFDCAAKFFAVDRATLIGRALAQDVVQSITEDVARGRRVIVFNKNTDGSFDVGMENPIDLETIEYVKRVLKAPVHTYLVLPEDMAYGLTFYGRRSADSFKKIIEDNIAASLRLRSAGADAQAEEVPIVAIVDSLISYALSSRASDIHIETLEAELLIRYRIDGILYEIARMPRAVHPAITARIKLLSGLKLDEHNKPQDGRFRYKAGTDAVDIRVGIMPTFYGEKIAMRLLSATARPQSLEELGMFEDHVALFKENAKKTYGMLLVTGPTGSGKTTTLYSLMNLLNRSDVNIVTIEDPIEYDMKYVNQTQVNPMQGITFATGLREIVRQDPNIVMVGEIRDEETADIAVQAALTGHLVLSTLHTNDAPSAVPRLFDLKILPFLAAAVLNVILAQRLVRKICLACITSYKPDEKLAASIQEQLTSLKLKEEVHVPKLLFKGQGCPTCNNTGYKGRIGIFEMLSVSEDIRRIIATQGFALESLYEQARKEGMVTMFQDGLRKVERGMTTIEEILRVIRE